MPSGKTVDEYTILVGRDRGLWNLKLTCCRKTKCRRCRGIDYAHGPYWYRFDGKRWHYKGRDVDPRKLREQLDLDLRTTASKPDAVLLGKTAKHGRRPVAKQARRRSR